MRKREAFTTLALAIFLAMPACTTTDAGRRVLDQDKVAQLAPALQATVAGATIYAYSKDPKAKDYLQVVQTALAEFTLSTNLSPAKLQATIRQLPIKELKTPEAQLLIVPILASYKAFAEGHVRAGIDHDAGLRQLLTAMVEGIKSGLEGIAATQP